VYVDKYMEENRSADIGCDVVRIFDVDPRKQWPLKVNHIVLGGYQLLRMPFVGDDKNRTQCLKDGDSPITWFLTSSNVRKQRIVLIYEILPFLMEQEAFGSEILWCPFPHDAENEDFRQDCMEVIDGYEKLMEFNARYDTNFRMGLAKLWLPRGQNFDRIRAYICRMSAAIDMIGYFYAQSRVLALGNFTTTDNANRMGETVDVENHSERKFVAEEYLDKEGYRLKDYCLRTIRQRIRKMFLMEGVEPSNWIEAKANRLIKAPGYMKGNAFIFYDAPTGAPFKEVMRERANIRTRFVLEDSEKKTLLPKLGGFKFGMMNFGSATVKRMDMSKMAKVLPGIGVKEELISPGYKSFPEQAIRRFKQERGENLAEERIVIPTDVRQDVPVPV